MSQRQRPCCGLIPAHAGKPVEHEQRVQALRLIPAHAGKTAGELPVDCRPTAHPRSRGENSIITLAFTIGTGSSPLTRGKPQTALIGALSGGLIPAHAGKTEHHSARSWAWTAHPRSRGENFCSCDAMIAELGSSPLTRGKRRVARCVRHCDQAHPRSRGENTRQRPSRRRQRGSSPLTRGKLHHPLRIHAARRLIPAHAGKRRSCVFNRHRGRLIPAHAGKT